MNIEQREGIRSRTHQPCAACRMLRRRCDTDCVLAPYFPGDQMEKFAGVHWVFGASNVIKMIQMVEETKREDAVKAIVFEARARLRDPVYGSTGAIFHLQKMVQELETQLESTRAQALVLQGQRDEFLMTLVTNQHHHHLASSDVSHHHDPSLDFASFFLLNDDVSMPAYHPPACSSPTPCDWIL